MAEASKTTPEVTLDEIVALCKRRGFIFQASEIYGGLASTYDYGHYGVLLKNNVKAEWWRAMVGERDDIVALDSAILQHPRVWEASGHLEGFTDPLVDCRTCKLRFRADDLEDAHAAASRRMHPGEYDDCDLTDPRQFNLMFKTHMGPWRTTRPSSYLRPETAQGIFINFKNVLQFARRKPPFGIAQVGKSFRNEITPGNFVFRTREFEQMEMEYFVPPDEAQSGSSTGSTSGSAGTRSSASGPTTCACASTRRGAVALLLGDLRHRVPVPDRLVRARGDRQPRRLRPHPARQVLRREARVLRPGARRGLRPARDRARRRRRPRDARLHRRRLRHRGVRGPKAHRARLHPRLAPVKVAVLPLVSKEGMPERAREIYEERAQPRSQPSTTRAARSASATAARTRSAPPGGSRSTARRWRTTP